MADTYITCSVSPCTVIHQIDLPPFQLETADGSLIGGAVLSIWAVGFCIRMLIRSLHSDGIKTESES